MNYKVLYRKYRPNSFDGVVGQQNTITLLKDSIINDKVSHAYIFSGPRGTGKTSTAKIFAKALNCSCLEDGNPCNKCDNCINFQQSSDIYEIDAASNNGVDQVREIIENIKLAPINSRYKVYIIDEVHMLSDSAFNALLLTLEEPPSHVVFILATTDIQEVPITILSRCQRLDFRKISNSEIIKQLKWIAETEKMEIDDEAMEEIAEFADGGMRDALSILDQLSKVGERITQKMVLESLGAVSNKMIDTLVQSIENNDADGVISFVNLTRENLSDFKSVCRRIIKVLEKYAVNIKLGNYRGNLDYDTCKSICFEITNCIYKNNVNIDSYALLELTLLSFVDNFTNNISREKTAENIAEETVGNNDAIEEQNDNVDISQDERMDEVNYFPSFSEERKSVRINNCFVDANKTYLSNAKPVWDAFLNLAKTKKEYSFILDTSIVLASDKILVIRADIDAIASQINENIALIEEAFFKYSSNKYQLVAIDKDDWEIQMQHYKDNLKNGVTYKLKEEPVEKKDEDLPVLNGIFSKQKIEVK